MDTTTSPKPNFRVKFRGGPLSGMTTDYDQEHPTYTIFGWVYEATGRRDGDHWIYVKQPKSKALRRFLQFAVDQSGHDPRLEDHPDPVRHVGHDRNHLCYCGSGKKYKRCHGRIG